jgi:hypothetical protein
MKKYLLLLLFFVILLSLNLQLSLEKPSSVRNEYAIVDYDITKVDYSFLNTASGKTNGIGGCPDRPLKATILCYNSCGGGYDFCSAVCLTTDGCSACYICFETSTTPVPLYEESY